MSVFVLIGLLAAIAMFWCVGLYKRLVVLRASALGALARLEQSLRSYNSLMVLQFPDEQGSSIPLTWDGMVGGIQTLDARCQAVRAAPLLGTPLRALAQTVDAINAEWSQLRAQPADLAGPTMPEGMQKLWEEATLQVRAARCGFNQAVECYNEALSQFPARLVVAAMGFKMAARL